MADVKKLNLTLDYRYVSLALLALLAGLLAWTRPWSATLDDNRTVSVSGEAMVRAIPDEFVFYPMYENKNADSQAGLAALSKKSDEVVAGLKKLGLSDEQIKTSANSYDKQFYPETAGDDEQTFTLQLTVTASSKEQAQTVQDYLLTTGLTGSISPYADFSDAKRKELETQARNEATVDARAKADQLAQNLGFKVGKVKTIEEQSGFGGIMPMDVSVRSSDDSASSNLSVQPGENEIAYTVEVVYYLD